MVAAGHKEEKALTLVCLYMRAKLKYTQCQPIKTLRKLSAFSKSAHIKLCDNDLSSATHHVK